MRTYSSFCGTVCSDSTGTVTSDAAVRLHRRYQLTLRELPFRCETLLIAPEGIEM